MIAKIQKEAVLNMNSEEKKSFEFPEGFLWGTATSAYQIEGGIVNDWSEWEKSKKRINKLEKEKLSIDDFTCGNAVDSYGRFEEDLGLVKKLNNNAIRFGLEWARIQPDKNRWDVSAINHYKELLEGAKKRGLKTVVTLWHWTIPLWVRDEKGWANKKTVEYFSEYVELIIKDLGGLVDYWVVLNEPMMFTFGGYISRKHPPQKFSLFKAEKVIKNLAAAHNKSYDLIHKYFSNAQVGTTNMLNYFEPAHPWNPIEVLLSKTLDYYWNRRIVRKTIKSDFFGVNYYYHDRMIWRPPFRKNKNEWVNDKGWEIYPEGIYHVLNSVKKYKKPILILENGLADENDVNRERFIKEHLYWAWKAIQEGADVRGYFHWSLLDNFEWAWGWGPKFGLYAVDRKTMERTARRSAGFYGEICKNNRLII
jgi:beta-glucosidase